MCSTAAPRGGGPGYLKGRRPLYAWSRSAALLCNQFSFSNAEIFTHAFLTLDRGPVIGETTHGGVISTGAHRLLDGAMLRVPFRGWFVEPTGRDMELGGAEPDIRVPVRPEDEIAGRDPQLDRAVEIFLERFESDLR